MFVAILRDGPRAGRMPAGLELVLYQTQTRRLLINYSWTDLFSFVSQNQSLSSMLRP